MATVRYPEAPNAAVLNVDNLDVTLDGSQVLAHLYAYDAGGNNWDRLRSTANGLLVDLAAAVAIDTELPAAAVLADDTPTPTVPGVGAFGMMYDGATWDMLRGTAALGLLVDTELAAAVALDDAISNPTTAPVGALNALFDGTDWERARVMEAPNALPGRVLGSQAVGKTEGKVTYRLAFKDLAGLTGLAVRLAGNASTVVRVTRVQIAKPSVDQAPLRVVKTNSAAHGGTFTSPTPIPLDSADAAAASALRLYTAIPANGDVAIGQVWQVDASGAPDFVDETADANSATAGDWAIYVAGDEIGDYVAIGFSEQFASVVFDNVSSGVAGIGGVVVWEYWDGDSWEPLTNVVDGTTGFTIAIVDGQVLTFDVPSDWAAQVLNGSANLFYIRARITTVFSTNPIYDQGFIGPGASEVATGSVYESDIAAADVLFETFGDEQNTQALTLRGIAETLEIELSAGATLNGYIEWTEE